MLLLYFLTNVCVNHQNLAHTCTAASQVDRTFPDQTFCHCTFRTSTGLILTKPFNHSSDHSLPTQFVVIVSSTTLRGRRLSTGTASSTTFTLQFSLLLTAFTTLPASFSSLAAHRLTSTPGIYIHLSSNFPSSIPNSLL